jgi:hypothetical protein
VGPDLATTLYEYKMPFKNVTKGPKSLLSYSYTNSKYEFAIPPTDNRKYRSRREDRKWVHNRSMQNGFSRRRLNV